MLWTIRSPHGWITLRCPICKYLLQSFLTRIVEKKPTVALLLIRVVRIKGRCSFLLDVSHLKWRYSWWRHQMETFSALLALCGGNPPVTGGYPPQKPVAPSFDIFFHLRLNKRLSKQSRRQCLRRHCAHYDVTVMEFGHLTTLCNSRFV